MKKLLFTFLFILLASIGLSDTMYNLPSPMIVPWASALVQTLANTSFTMDSTDDMCAFTFQMPATGTLSDVAFLTGTVTDGGNDNIPVGLYALDTNGLPDTGTPTLYKANATGTITIADADDSVLKTTAINGATGIAATLGDVAAFVFGPAAGTPNMAILKYSTGPGGSLAEAGSSLNAGAWTKTLAYPFFAVKIGGVWYAPQGCIGGVTNGNLSESYATTVQKGILINEPVSMRVIGIAVNASLAAATTVTFGLYSDPTGTPVQRAVTPAIDTDLAASTSPRAYRVIFTAPYTIAANTNYVAAMIPGGATTLGLSYFPADSTYAAAFPTGSTGTWYSRADASSAFAEVAGPRIPVMGIIVDQVGVPVGGTIFIGQNRLERSLRGFAE